MQYSQHVVDGGSETQVVTNHLLHQPAPTNVSVETDPSWTRTRLARLTEAVNSTGDKRSHRQFEKIHAGVCFTKAFARGITGNPEADTSERTIWHSIYDIDARNLEVSFLSWRHPGGTDRRSPYQSFQLEGQTDAGRDRGVGQTE